MDKGIRVVPSEGDKVKYVSKTVDPTTSDFSYPIPTIWLNTSSNKAWMHFGSGVWIQTAGSGGGGEWGAAVVKTISGGAITVEAGRWYKLVPESGNSDNLDTINGLSEGEEVLLSTNNAAYTITLRSGVDNLSLPGGVNITLNAILDMARLIYNGTNITESSSRP